MAQNKSILTYTGFLGLQDSGIGVLSQTTVTTHLPSINFVKKILCWWMAACVTDHHNCDSQAPFYFMSVIPFRTYPYQTYFNYIFTIYFLLHKIKVIRIWKKWVQHCLGGGNSFLLIFSLSLVLKLKFNFIQHNFHMLCRILWK